MSLGFFQIHFSKLSSFVTKLMSNKGSVDTIPPAQAPLGSLSST